MEENTSYSDMTRKEFLGGAAAFVAMPPLSACADDGQSVAPQFADGAALAVRTGRGKNRGGGAVKSEEQPALEIESPPANRPCAGRLFDYRVTIAGSNGATDEKFVFAEGFHRSATSKRANAPTVFKVALGALSARGDLEIRVAPRNSLGAEGRALTARLSLSDENVKYAMRLNGTKEINVVRPEAAIDTGLNMYLFAQNKNGSAALKSSVRCYGVKIWQDGKLVRDFRPCMKNGAGCLYDAVARKIFYPLGGALEAVERQVATQGPIPS